MPIEDWLDSATAELSRTTPAFQRLARNEDALGRLLKLYEAGQDQAVRKLLEELRLTPYCLQICRWLCIWHCIRVCRRLCPQVPDEPFKLPDLQRYSKSLGALADNEDISKQLLEAVARQNADMFQGVLKEFKLEPFCLLVCYWICHLHCRRFCRLICPPLNPVEEIPVLDEFRQVALAAAKLAEDEDALAGAVEASQAGEAEKLREIFAAFQFPCLLLCRWLCFWHCHHICFILCGSKITRDFGARDLQRFMLSWVKLASDEGRLRDLAVAVQRQDKELYGEILERFELQRYCHLICRWICHVHCGFYCRLVCPPSLRCELEEPKGCVSEEFLQEPPALVIPVRGTAAGGDFDHYVLEWSTDDLNYQADHFHYPPIPPGGGGQGNSPVVSGLLAYFDTTSLDADDYFIRMTVFSKQNATRVCKTQFSLFKQDVRILGVSGFTNLDKPALDPDARFVETFTPKCSAVGSKEEVSFGRGISVQGSAFIGGCDEKKIKRYTLSYKAGHETNCGSTGWTEFWKVEYNSIWQYRDMNMRQDTDTLTARWVDDCVVTAPFPPYCLWNVPEARLSPSSWQSRLSACQLSGLHTLRLNVEDVNGNEYCDLQRVWFDNKPIHAQLRIDGVAACADLKLSDFTNVPDCSVPWKLKLVGIAYDEYIDETLLPLNQRPNDNFDHYWIKVAKQGGTEVQIPIDAPDGSCFHGTQRVGEPGDRCQSSGGSDVTAKLADFDLRAIDPICKANTSFAASIPASFTLPRGKCCVYVFRMRVFDTTKFSGGPHRAEALWPVKICNDLPQP